MHPLNVLVLVVNSGSSPCVCAQEEERVLGAGWKKSGRGAQEDRRREEKAGRDKARMCEHMLERSEEEVWEHKKKVVWEHTKEHRGARP
jgi:hypothetical protein